MKKVVLNCVGMGKRIFVGESDNQIRQKKS